MIPRIISQAMSETTPQTAWSAKVLTLFPEMFPGPLGQSVAGRALKAGRWQLEALDIRAHATDRHGTVDDAPFGGGAGMVMKPDVIGRCMTASAPHHKLIYPTPRGRLLTQSDVKEWAAAPGLSVLCGRYEGVDQRVIEAYGFEEVSIGDYVLSGGELAAMVLIDAVVRLLPGVMGNEATADEESFEGGLLEYPHYTRPERWVDEQGREWTVPEVLTSGHHANIRQWRLEEARRITRERRPDLLGGGDAVGKD